MTEKKSVKHMQYLLADSGLLEIDHIGAGVGVILYSRQNNTAAGLHIMDVHSTKPAPPNPARYANTAIPHALGQLKKKGVEPPLSVAIAGGAGMADMPDEANIGPKITEAVKNALAKEKLDIQLDQTGGTKIRTMTLHIDAAKIKIS